MRAVPLVVVSLGLAACTQSPQQKQADQLRAEARNQGDAIKQRAEEQAAPLDQQAAGLSKQAAQAGGYTGKRLDVQADALKEQARLLREQADKQAAAVKETADARIKTIESR